MNREIYAGDVCEYLHTAVNIDICAYFSFYADDFLSPFQLELVEVAISICSIYEMTVGSRKR